MGASLKYFIHLIERNLSTSCEDTCHQGSVIWSLRVLSIDVHEYHQVITALNLMTSWSVLVGLLSSSCSLEVLWF